MGGRAESLRPQRPKRLPGNQLTRQDYERRPSNQIVNKANRTKRSIPSRVHQAEYTKHVKQERQEQEHRGTEQDERSGRRCTIQLEGRVANKDYIQICNRNSQQRSLHCITIILNCTPGCLRTPENYDYGNMGHVTWCAMFSLCTYLTLHCRLSSSKHQSQLTGSGRQQREPITSCRRVPTVHLT